MQRRILPAVLLPVLSGTQRVTDEEGDGVEFGVAAVAVVVGFPILVLAGVLGLCRLEAWILEPEERAHALGRLLEKPLAADDVERQAIRLLERAEPLNGWAPRTRARSRAASA